MISRLTSLTENIIQFCRFLRQRGFSAGTEEEVLIFRAFTVIDYTQPAFFRAALKSILCKNKKQTKEFDKLFDEYWKQMEKAVDAKPKEKPFANKQSTQKDSLKTLRSWLHGNKNNETEETATYSLALSLSKKDFSAIPDDELDEMLQVIKSVARRLAAKKSRRDKFSYQMQRPDLRQTLRKNLRRGGELFELSYRKPKQNKTKLLLLCDVSKSMELYAVFLIQFLYAMQQVYGRIETFVFGTALKRVTDLLKDQDFNSAMRLLAEEEMECFGGTRIGECLASFVKDYSSVMLDKKTIVIIVSDGWDIGDMEVLRKSMEWLHRKARKLIWLNPLAGYENYLPDVIGMQTAMPFIDVFAAGHNVESLRSLRKWI